MEFSCPACATPHSFPNDQVPSGGIVVACTNCGTHITLDGAPEVADDGATSAMDQGQLQGKPAASPAWQAPPAPPTGGGEEEDVLPRTMALTGDALADLPPIGSVPAPEPAQKAPPPPSPVKIAAPPAPAPAPDVPMVDPFAAAAPEPAPEPVAASAPDTSPAPAAGPSVAGLGVALAPAEGAWSWRDLPKAFGAIKDPKRMASMAAIIWVLIVVLVLLDMFSGWLGTKVSVLGTVFSVINGILAFAGISAVIAMAAFMGFKTIVEGQNAPLKTAANWTQHKALSVLGTPLAFVGAILAIATAMAILAGIGKIPYVGPIVFGLTMPATIVLGLAGGLVAVIFFYCFSLYVPLIYSEGTGPVETLKRLMELFRENALPIVGYTLLTGLMITVAFTLTVGPVLAIDHVLTTEITSGILEDDYIAMIAESPRGVGGLMSVVMDPQFARPEDMNIGHGIGGLLGGVFAMLLPAFVIGLLVQVQTAAGGIIYAAMTRRQK